MTNLLDTHTQVLIGLDTTGDIQYYLNTEHAEAEGATQVVPCLVTNADTLALKDLFNSRGQEEALPSHCEDFPCCGHEANDCNGQKYGSDASIKLQHERTMELEDMGIFGEDY